MHTQARLEAGFVPPDPVQSLDQAVQTEEDDNSRVLLEQAMEQVIRNQLTLMSMLCCVQSKSWAQKSSAANDKCRKLELEMCVHP